MGANKLTIVVTEKEALTTLEFEGKQYVTRWVPTRSGAKMDKGKGWEDNDAIPYELSEALESAERSVIDVMEHIEDNLDMGEPEDDF